MLLTSDQELGRNRALHARRVERVISAMADRLHLPMSNQEMADIACFSPCHFNRLFRRVTGIPPVHFHYALRIARAKELLIETEMDITEICYDVGYNSLGTFITRFGELVGVSPMRFRRLARRIAGMRLQDLLLDQPRLSSGADRRSIVGTIESATPAAIVFTGLFRRAIPEGCPSACAIMHDGVDWVLPTPADGLWHILSVEVPCTFGGVRLLTLKDLRRGRSAPIRVQGGHCSGRTIIKLLPPSPLDPPILTTIPIQIAHSQAPRHLTSSTQAEIAADAAVYLNI